MTNVSLMGLIRNFYSIITLIFLVQIPRGVAICPKPCFCSRNKQMAVCNARYLRWIPRFPSYIRNIKLIQNNFTSIDTTFFKNVTAYNKILTLNMTDNLMYNISGDAFRDFKYLKLLELSKETNLEIGKLKTALQSLGSSLECLILREYKWESLPGNLFSALQNKNISHLSLAGNGLKDIDQNVFYPVKNIEFLDLSSNKLSTVSLLKFNYLTKLVLTENDLQEVPSGCYSGNQSLVPKLSDLYLDKNSITKINTSSFHCMEYLNYLRLDFNNFRFLENNTFSSLKRLKKLHLSNLARLMHIEGAALNSSSLEYLYLGNNRFHFNKQGNYYPKMLFRYCTNLQTLDLSNNFLPSAPQTLKTILLPLAKLNKLTLMNTRLRYFPFCVLEDLRLLTSLNLQSNYISGWISCSAFGNTSSLKKLNLQSNNIKLVNKTSFPASLLSKLESLDLSENQFSCTCEQKWFRDWIRENVESPNRKLKLDLKGYPIHYKCKFPHQLNEVRLQNYNPTEEMCHEQNLVRTVVVVIVSVVVAVTATLITLHRCQANIRNYIYLVKFNWKTKLGYIQLDSVDYMYEAFVVYTSNDTSWVHEVLLKKLEEEENMKICIHQRDFDLGAPVTANIGKYMELCRKIVVVMSNSFAESEWCQWEVDLVQERRRRQGKDVSILIMLENIDSNHMTDSLKTLLNSVERVEYCTGIGENLFWKALVKWIRKPIGQPPVAVL